MTKTWQRKHISNGIVLLADCQSSQVKGEQTANAVYRLTGAPYKVIVAKLYQLVDLDLMDYGVSVETAWWQDDDGNPRCVTHGRPKLL